MGGSSGKKNGAEIHSVGVPSKMISCSQGLYRVTEAKIGSPQAGEEPRFSLTPERSSEQGSDQNPALKISLE